MIKETHRLQHYIEAKPERSRINNHILVGDNRYYLNCPVCSEPICDIEHIRPDQHRMCEHCRAKLFFKWPDGGPPLGTLPQISRVGRLWVDISYDKRYDTRPWWKKLRL